MTDFDLAKTDTLPDEVVSSIDVFCPSVVFGVLGKCLGAFINNMQRNRT